MPTESFDVLSTSDPRWDEALDGTEHDFYHRRGYHALAEWNGEGQAFLAMYEGRGGVRLLWPYLRRPIDGTDLFDVTCVIGYAGPVARGIDAADDPDVATLHSAWREIRRLWADQRVVGAFTTFHPLIANERLVAGFRGDPGGVEPAVVSPGRTVSIDLTGTPAERMAAYEKETRYEIRRAHRRGVDVVVDTDLVHLGDLARLYDATMRRNDASQRHRLNAAYFEQLFDDLRGHAHLLVATYGGEVVCALVVVIDGAYAHAHVTGVSDRHYRLSPLTTTLGAAADFAQDHGARWLHLGAGRGAQEDSLFSFKRRIGDVLRPYNVGRWVTDARLYRELCDGAGAPVTADPSHFPAYRRPSS